MASLTYCICSLIMHYMNNFCMIICLCIFSLYHKKYDLLYKLRTDLDYSEYLECKKNKKSYLNVIHMWDVHIWYDKKWKHWSDDTAHYMCVSICLRFFLYSSKNIFPELCSTVFFVTSSSRRISPLKLAHTTIILSVHVQNFVVARHMISKSQHAQNFT